MPLLAPAELSAFYSLFVNALSFTVAINIVDNTADVGDLLLTAGTVFIALLFSMISAGLLAQFNDRLRTKSQHLHSDVETFLNGPLQAAAFVLRTFITVQTHFLSTTLGRWLFLTLDTSEMENTELFVVVVTLLILAWLIALSAGFLVS